MQSDICTTYSQLFSETWLSQLEQKLDVISAGQDVYWEEKLNLLRLMGKDVVPYKIPNDNCRAEIIKLIMHKVIFQDIYSKMEYVQGSCNGDYDLEGNTLLHHLVKEGLCGNAEKACAFIQETFDDQMVNVSKQNIKGMTPFHEALCLGENKETCESIIPLLFEKCEKAEYDFTKVDGYGRTCLHLLASHVYKPTRGSWCSCEETIANMEALLSKDGGRALLNVRDSIGFTAFDCAIICKNFTVAKFLWKEGADPLEGICGKEYDIDEAVVAFDDRVEDEKYMQDVYKYIGEELRQPDITFSLELLKSSKISSIALDEAIAKFEEWFKSSTCQTKEGKEFLCSELKKVIKKISNDIATISSIALNEVVGAFHEWFTSSVYQTEEGIVLLYSELIKIIRIASQNRITISTTVLDGLILKFKEQFELSVYQTEESKEFLSRELTKIIGRALGRINTRSGGGTTLLHNAVASGDCKLVENALQLGADPNIFSKKGQDVSPLGLAIITQRKDIVAILMRPEYNAKWPGLSLSGTTLPFYIVTTCKSAKMLEFVLEKENEDANSLYAEGEKTLSYLEWAFVRQSPIAIFELLRLGGSLDDCKFFTQ